mgnify:CR=1 FL=1
MTLVPRGNFFDIDRAFDNFWSPAKQLETPESGFFSPRVDIKELDNCYEITAELPGVKKNDIHVTLEDGVLSISAETCSEEKEEDKGRVIRQERRYGKYLRSFTLGNNIHEEDISADFTDGVLKLKAPDDVPQKRRISIDG